MNLDPILKNMDKISLGAASIFAVGAGAVAMKHLLEPSATVKSSVPYDENVYGGRVFAQCFHNHNVQYVFTLIGGHISPIVVGCEELGMRVIDVRHEVNTVFCADAVSRLTGIPGVAVVTAGPGVTNTITALKNAQMAQSPVILIGGATSDLLKGMGSLQDIDQMSLVKSIVKWSKHVKSLSDIAPSVEEAFYQAQSGTPGPVFLEVAVDVLYKESTTRQFYLSKKPSSETIANRIKNWYINRHLSSVFDVKKEIIFHNPRSIDIPRHSSGQVEKVANILKSAKRPALMLGSQVMLVTDEVKSGSFTKAINKMGIPTVLSGSARGVLGSNNPLQVIHKPAKAKALKNADVVILAGVPCDFRLDYGQKISHRSYYISVNRDSEDLYKNRRPNYAVLADPCLFLMALSESLPEISGNISQWRSDLAEQEEVGRKKVASDALAPSDLLNPLYVCQEIEKAASDDAIFIADGGDFVGSASYVLRPRRGLAWLDPGAFGTLGCGMGFAIGAKLTNPLSEVWIIFGDGAVGFSIAEFDTCVRLKIPVIAVVGNDACWTQIFRDQINFLNRDTACMLDYTNYQDVAIGFGAAGIIVKTKEDLPEALRQAKKIASGPNPKPVLINVLIGKSDFRKGSISM